MRASMLPRSTEQVSISLPTWLIEQIDKFCEAQDMTRSGFLQRAARKQLLCELDSPRLWDRLYGKDE